jgi:hypothetical protein
MKNYFAKLVARSAPPHDSTPVARESTKVRDPFEQVAAPVMPEPFPETARETTSSATATTSPVAHGPVAEKRALPSLRAAPPATTANGGRLWQSELSASRTSEQAGDSPPLAASKRSEPVETTPPKLIHPVRTAAARSPPHELKPAETWRPGLSDEHDPDQHFADVQREQTMLLRKADAFMNELFEERARFQSGGDLEEESESHQPESLLPLSQPIENPRLKPAQAAEATREPDAEQPSLVIGRLTVEVAPSVPPPATPRAPIVVVREAGRGSHNGISSSQRFGLGQF